MSQPEPRTLPPIGTTILLALCAALLLYRLGAVPLIGPDEPRYSRVAVEMARSGDLVTPTLQGEPWLEKPPLYYWMAASAFRALGENEAAARLPSLLALLVTVGATAVFGARLYGARAGLVAGFVVGTSLLCFAYGRAASMDMLLTATLTAGLALLGLRRLGIAGPAAAVAGAGLLGLATVAKGPLGLVVPVLVLLPHAWLTRRARGPALVTYGSVCAFLATALPWYALELVDQGEVFVRTFLLDHNLLRFTSTRHNHPGSVFYYVPVVLLGLFPWSGLVLPALGRFDRRAVTDLFVGLWVAFPFAFFSAAGSKLPGYILPVLPPLAVLMGRGAVALLDGLPLPRGLGPRAAAVLAAVLGVAVGLAPWLMRLEPAGLRGLLLAPASAGALTMLLAAGLFWREAPREGLKVLRAGAAAFLLLLATGAPPLLSALESGRDLFRPARGREVLVWGAWRTAWMAGYFYNDARVREVKGAEAIVEAARREPVLVLCAPYECSQVERLPAVEVTSLATGPRQNRLLEVKPKG
jgi:4-amino-4-deoxy-L-arabinose transferase-like glycosyltransferase